MVRENFVVVVFIHFCPTQRRPPTVYPLTQHSCSSLVFKSYSSFPSFTPAQLQLLLDTIIALRIVDTDSS